MTNISQYAIHQYTIYCNTPTIYTPTIYTPTIYQSGHRVLESALLKSPKLLLLTMSSTLIPSFTQHTTILLRGMMQSTHCCKIHHNISYHPHNPSAYLEHLLPVFSLTPSLANQPEEPKLKCTTMIFPNQWQITQPIMM